MDSNEISFQHPLIVCNHSLDISDFENLGKQLSELLTSNVNMIYSEKSNTFDKIIIYQDSTNTVSFSESYSLLISEMKFYLKFKEFKFIIYADFFEIKFDINMDYFHLKQLNEQENLLKIRYFEMFFNALSSLDIQEVYIGVFKEFKKPPNTIYCWEIVEHGIQKNANYFKIEI